MTEDFAVLDFAVVHAEPAKVARALAAAWPAAIAEPAGNPDAARAAKPSGLLGRLMARRAAIDPAEPAQRLSLHPSDHAPNPPYARKTVRVPRMADSAIRLSAPSAPPAGRVTLIELLEDLEGDARLCKALSKLLPGEEVFFFRYSGSLHPGAHFAFHVYKDGRTLRRAASESLSGDHGEAPWNAIDTGMPHPAEADSLPPPEAPAADIMTPERQGAILSALGIDAESLFSDLADRSDIIVLSPEAGGAPLSELDAHDRADLRRPPAFEPEPEQEAEPQAQLDQAQLDLEDASDWDAEPDAAAPSTPQGAPQPQATDDPPPAQTHTRPPLSPLGPDAPLPQDPTAWEQEVTNLLLALVEAALPDTDRIAWLQSFTAQLESGGVEAALDSALDLIARTDRDPQDRERAAARLGALYAHLRAEQTG